MFIFINSDVSNQFGLIKLYKSNCCFGYLVKLLDVQRYLIMEQAVVHNRSHGLWPD